LYTVTLFYEHDLVVNLGCRVAQLVSMVSMYNHDLHLPGVH